MTDRESTALSSPLDVPGVQNFRDAAIGSLLPGRLYRSGHLALLTPDGAERLKGLGIRTVIDLRTPSELTVLPDRRHGLDFDLLHHPVLPDRASIDRASIAGADRAGADGAGVDGAGADGAGVDGAGPGRRWPEQQAEMYLFMPEVGGPAIADTVRRLAAPGSLPALVHCAVGKDRTGLAVAIVQTLIGASESAVVADFLQSNPNLGLDAGPISYLDEYGEEHLSKPVAADHLLAALAHIRDLHGSLAGYLRAYGVRDDELAALRNVLTA